MCRYAWSGPYKLHYACFGCRKTFKQPPIEDYLEVHGLGWVFKQLQGHLTAPEILQQHEVALGHRLDDLCALYGKAVRSCPECQQPMVEMGLDLKAPRQADERSWRILRDVHRMGHEFRTCGCNGPGWIPASAADYRAYLESRRETYRNRLKAVVSSNTLQAESLSEAKDHWKVALSRIEAELASLQ